MSSSRPLASLALLLGVAACNLTPDLPRLIALEPAAPELRLENVAVFEPGTASTVTGQTVVVQGDIIAWAGPATAAALPAPASDAVIVNGRGKTLLPGLVDAHVHLGIAGAPPWLMRQANPQRNMDAMLLAGVTTVFEPGGFADVTEGLRAGVREGRLDGPDIYSAGLVFTAPDGHPFPMAGLQVPRFLLSLLESRVAYVAEDLDDLPDLLERFDAAGADFMKLIIDDIPFDAPVLSDALIAGAVAHAHARGRKVFAHVGSPQDALRAARAGVDVLAHTPYDDRLTAGDIAELRRRGLAVMSTQRIWVNTVALATSPAGFPLRPQAKRVFDPEVTKVLEAPRPADWAPPESFAPWLDFIASDKRYQVANLAALYQAGVTVIAATDSPNLGMAPGDAMHQELQEVVAAGIPAGAALRAATLNPAKLLGLEGRIGTIAPGKRADLLLLDGDPTVDIRNTERIAAVWTRGRRVVPLQGDER